MCPYLPSDTSGPVCRAGFIPTLHEQDEKEPARLPPQQQPKNGSSCKVVLGFGKVWKTALVKEGTAWLAWTAPQSSSWWSRFCADKPFRGMICQGSAKYMKIEIIYFRSLYLAQGFFFFRNGKRHIFDIRLTALPIFMALLQTTQALEFHKCL